MGVKSLWEILSSTGKPVRLESLSNMRLAVDASIWIYQFLKAARDKEGNRMINSHVVGFFRRICKLLFFGTRPIFVFDGGAPALKMETIRQRKLRRQGQQDNLNATARKLLAIEIHNKQGGGKEGGKEKDTLNSFIFRPSDEYELPNIPGFVYSMSDSRITPEEDYKAVLDTLDELEGIDLDSINPASREFDELPKSTQYLILSASRLRSRLRLGYSKGQLKELFPDSMDFSKFQIEMVKRRNFFTQKLMDVTGMHNGGADKVEISNRILNQRDRQYKLIKTETGWAMSLGEQDGSEVNRAVLLDDFPTSFKHQSDLERDKKNYNVEEDEISDDIEWEDVEINPKKTEEVPDYSTNAAILPIDQNLGRTVGSQSFLDTRENDTKNIVNSSNTYDMRTKDIDISYDDDSGDEYIKQIQEIESMEALQKSRNLKILKNVQKDKERSKHEPIDQLHDNRPIDVIMNQQNTKECNSVHFTEGVSSSNVSMPTKIFTDLNSLKSSASIGSFDILPLTDETGKIPTVPQFKLSKESSLFNSQKEKGAESKKRKKDGVETPEWFKSNAIDGTFNTSAFDFNKSLSAYERSSVATREFGNPSDGIKIERVRERYNSNDKNENSSDPEVIEKTSTDKDVDFNSETDESLQKKHSSQASDNTAHNSTLCVGKSQNQILDYYFSEDEENELANQLEMEVEDYNVFRKTLNPNITNTVFLEDELYKQGVKNKRDADEVTPEMIQEIQDLLSKFGIPYITAPMEAEAQCAELLRLELVDGIITDDSDIFLFGGSKVYKNMFHEKNYVEYYNSDVIEMDLGLNRERLIALAQLLGSDYTTGIKNVGRVLGMEILAEFGDLEKFRIWYNGGQFDKAKQDKENNFQKNLRKRLVKNQVILEDEFPGSIVRNAYLNPIVDHDTTKFVWGIPDLDRLRKHMAQHVGWPKEKTDEVLVPLIKDLNKRKATGTQRTLVEFYPTKLLETDKKLRLGKRIQDATRKLKKRRMG